MPVVLASAGSKAATRFDREVDHDNGVTSVISNSMKMKGTATSINSKTPSELYHELSEDKKEHLEKKQMLHNQVQQLVAEEQMEEAAKSFDSAGDLPWAAKTFIEAMIVANALQLGMCAQPEGKTGLEEFCMGSEHVFIAVFSVEVILKLYLLRCNYFCYKWNLLDFGLSFSGVVDSWILTPLLDGTDVPMRNMYFMRLMRLIRILRMVKVLRSHRELQMLLEGLVGALRSMVWVATLLGMLIYTFAIICVTLFSHIPSDSPLDFSTLPRAAFTLFTLSIIADWTDIVWPVVELYPWSAIIFVFFTIVSTFGVLNLIIGVVTEKTAQVQSDYARKEQEMEDEIRMHSISAIADIVFSSTVDNNVTSAEMQRLLNHEEHGPSIRELVEGVSLPYGHTLMNCFSMFDRDASGEVTRDEFCHGMKRLIFSNNFQRSCMVQSSVADVMIEMKAMELRLVEEIHKVKTQVCTRDDDEDRGSNGGGACSGGGGGALSSAVVAAKNRPAAHHGDSDPDDCCFKDLQVFSHDLLDRLREPLAELLIEGLNTDFAHNRVISHITTLLIDSAHNRVLDVDSLSEVAPKVQQPDIRDSTSNDSMHCEDAATRCEGSINCAGSREDTGATYSSNSTKSTKSNKKALSDIRENEDCHSMPSDETEDSADIVRMIRALYGGKSEYVVGQI